MAIKWDKPIEKNIKWDKPIIKWDKPVDKKDIPKILKNLKEHPIKSVFTPLATTATGKSLEERAVEATTPTYIKPSGRSGGLLGMIEDKLNISLSPEYLSAFAKQAGAGMTGAVADLATTPSTYIPLPVGKVLGKIPIGGTTLGKIATTVPLKRLANIAGLSDEVAYQSALKNLPGRAAASKAIIPKTKLSTSGQISLDPVQKVTDAIKKAGTQRQAQEILYTAERGKRIGVVKEIGSHLRGQDRFKAQLGALKGELKKVDFDKLDIEQGDINSILDLVEYSPNLSNQWERVSGQNGLMKLFGETGGFVPTNSELDILRKVFPEEFVSTLLTKRTALQNMGLTVANVLNMPRALRASFDLSAPLRQGIFLINKPRQWVPAFKNMVKYAFNEKAYEGLLDDIRSRPTHDLMKQGGLAITKMSKDLSQREEMFMSDYAERLPFFVGKIVKGSNRAYSGFLNQLRADVFDSFIVSAEKTGVKVTNKFVKDTAKFINAATGRGSLPDALEAASVALNTTFFSPKLIASRLNLMNPVFYTQLHPMVRKEALKSLVTLGGVVGTVLGLAKANGAEVGLDPRSADFGKIKLGNTRYDVMGGFQQYIRLIAQLTTGQHVSSTTGVVTTVGEGYKPLNRAGILGRFAESKLAPVPSTILNTLRGEGFGGQKLNMGEQVSELFIPMVWQDLSEISKEQGFLKGSGMLMPGVFGVGVQTYAPTADDVVRSARSATRFAKELYKQGKAQEATQMLDENKDIIDLGSKLYKMYDGISKLESRKRAIKKNVKFKQSEKAKQYEVIDYEIQRIETEMEKIMENNKRGNK